MPLYQKLFLEYLKVPKKYLDTHADVIRERLERAADEFARDHGNLFAINICLHAASSIILSNPDYLRKTLDEIKNIPGLEAGDPTTVLTVSALYYLIFWDTRRTAADSRSTDAKLKSQAALQEVRLGLLREGFQKINWMVGPDEMRILGIE